MDLNNFNGMFFNAYIDQKTILLPEYLTQIWQTKMSVNLL